MGGLHRKANKSRVADNVDKFTHITDEDHIERVDWLFEKFYIGPMVEILKIEDKARRRFWDKILMERK